MKKVLIFVAVCLLIVLISSCSGGKKCPAYSDNTKLENAEPNS